MKRKLEFNNEKGCNFHIYLSCHEESACCDIDVANKASFMAALAVFKRNERKNKKIKYGKKPRILGNT